MTLQISRRSQGPPAENGLPDSSSPSIPAPIRASNIAIELPKSLDRKMTLDDFSFLKVNTSLTLVQVMYNIIVQHCIVCAQKCFDHNYVQYCSYKYMTTPCLLP